MDKVKILYKSIYSKYKTNKKNLEIAQINSILFKSQFKNIFQSNKILFKEMTITSDFEEYFQNFSYKDSIIRLKLLGYIYTNNFKLSPNYLSMGEDIYFIMLKFFREKQDLIDRNIYDNILKEKKNKNRLENAIIDYNNFFLNSKNFSKSSSCNSLNNKNHSSENKFHEETKNQNNKKFLFSLTKRDNESKFIKDNSIDSIKRWMDKIKKRNIKIIKNNNVGDNSINYNKKTKIEIKKLNENKIPIIKRNKMISSMQISQFNNKNKIIQTRTKSNNKEYRLSVDSFKEKMKNSRKQIIKQHIENFWKINKNFVTNLIEKNSKIINFKRLSLNGNNFVHKSLSENSKHFINNYINKLSRCPKNIENKNTKNTNFILYKYNISKRYKLKNNSLTMKIQNESNFMKNKNCVFAPRKENKIIKKFQNKNNLSKKFFNNKYLPMNKNKKNKFPARIMKSYSCIK